MSNQDKQEILEKVKTYLDMPGSSRLAIKQELDELIEPGSSRAYQDQVLATELQNLKISYPAKFPKYQKGENFARYCEKFQEHVLISNTDDPNLYIYFLQNVDDETYAKLKSVELTELQKADAISFCPVFKKKIYGNQVVQLINEVRDCKQNSDESIADYAYRLSEKANIAYTDPSISERDCFMTFLRGVNNITIRRKLNEATSLNNFNDAVDFAKQLESVEARFHSETESFESKPILKESTVQIENGDSNDLNNSRSNRISSNSSNKRRGRSRSRSPASLRKSPNKYGKTHNSNYDRYQQPRRAVRCWTCDKIGHVSRNCWHNTSRPPQGQNFWNNAQVQNQGPQHLN